jgi:hypothetical protein
VTTLTPEREWISNCPGIDPDAPIDYGLTERGMFAPPPEGDEPTRRQIMQALFAVKGE